MDSRKDKFISLTDKFKRALTDGSLDQSSEETIRVWINEMLSIFGWDVRNTQHIIQERVLGSEEQKRLRTIGSRNVRPDYTLMNGKVKLCFLDAKSLNINLRDDKSAAFQIRSYGWSIGAPYSIITNMRELAIYDCSSKPNVNDPASFARYYYFRIEDYSDNFETIDAFLFRDEVIHTQYLNLKNNREPVDTAFAAFLGNFRLKLVRNLIEENIGLVGSLENVLLWAQIILDRIIFIRVCEARGLEKDGLLLSFQEKGFWRSFEKCSYLDFFKHYDGPMFKHIKAIHNLQIKDDVFEELLSYLYYPSPYKFDVIPLKTISDIYELFLSNTLVVNGNDVEIVMKDEYRKSRGAVTTPQAIVHNVVRQTIEVDALGRQSLNELFATRFVDPACGSGVFIIGIYEYLVEVFKNYFLLHPEEMGEYAIVNDKDVILTIKGRRAIITNCIYGVDIDPEAVEVAKMSLSLKIIDDYYPEDFEKVGIQGDMILNGVGDNILLGNTLVSSDILELYPNLLENVRELANTHIFDWREAFPVVFENGGFDYVIGNPPYVEVKNYNQGLPTMAMFVKNHYRCCNKGKVDLSIPFIEKGLELLNDHGRLGYIVQKRFFKTEYGTALRQYVTESNLLHSIYDYKENDLFRGRTTYVAIIVFDKDTSHNQMVSYMESNVKKKVGIPLDCLDAQGWSLDNVPLTMLSKKLTDSLGSLGEAFDVKVGIQVLWVNAYHIHVDRITDGYIYGKSNLDTNVKVEAAACRKLVCNDQFIPLYGPVRQTYILFPYDVIDGVKRRIPFSEFASRFPNAGRYLLKHKATIIGSVQIQPARSSSLDVEEYWHIFTRENNIECRYPKVVIPMTTVYPQAAVVKEFDVYGDNANVNYIQIEDGHEERLYALAAVINSRIFGLLAYNKANPSNNGYRKFNKEFLKPIPFPVRAFAQKDARLHELYAIALNIEQLRTANVNSSNLGIEKAIDFLWDKIDTVCRSLYGLTDEEWSIFEREGVFER